MATKNEPAEPAKKPEAQGQRIRWDGSAMRTTYANVCQVTSTREEFVMMFGVNQAWSRGQPEITIQLTDRIILNPFAAKRFAQVLGDVIREYESRFGELPLEAPAQPQPARGKA